MAKKSNRETVALLCLVCKGQNYITRRNKINLDGNKLELKKFCRKCKKTTKHKETTKLK